VHEIKGFLSGCTGGAGRLAGRGADFHNTAPLIAEKFDRAKGFRPLERRFRNWRRFRKREPPPTLSESFYVAPDLLAVPKA